MARDMPCLLFRVIAFFYHLDGINFSEIRNAIIGQETDSLHIVDIPVNFMYREVLSYAALM